MPTPRPPRTAADRKRTISLISMYFVGVALGCVLVGLILQLKHAYAARMEPAKQVEQQQVSNQQPVPPTEAPASPTTVPKP